jgi:tellurite resistance protein
MSTHPGPAPSGRFRLRVVPASFFGIVLGLAGLANAWRAAHAIWNLPSAVGDTLALLVVIIWAALVVLYCLKWLTARDDASREVAHPVQCCFVGLIGVATMLAAGGMVPYLRTASEAVFVAGAAFTLFFAVWCTGGLWQGERNIAATTPVIYLPTVAGSFVTATVAAALGYQDWGQLAFGAGLFSWLTIESVLLHRLLFASSLSEALRPTLGIQLAPAPVGAVAYLSVTQGPPDIFAHALIGYALLQAVVLVRLLPWIWRGSFSPSYWAFAFGATALATAPLLLIQRGDTGAVAQLAPYIFVVANAAVGAIASGTVWLAARGRLLPMPAGISSGAMARRPCRPDDQVISAREFATRQDQAMNIQKTDTAVVFIDSQNDELSEKGKTGARSARASPTTER